jgi:23S rRNA pseudouridine2605 synthase
VLLLTNDGELAHRLAHPRYEIDKVYVADVEGRPSDETLRTLEQGVVLDDGPTAPATARRLRPARVELTIHEGRTHQVKRMLAEVGHPVTRLHRSRYGPLEAGGLAEGEWRELSTDEVATLRRAARL